MVYMDTLCADVSDFHVQMVWHLVLPTVPERGVQWSGEDTSPLSCLQPSLSELIFIYYIL